MESIEINKFKSAVILHTWEINMPPISVRNFIKAHDSYFQFFVSGTSGSGDLKIHGVDGISSVSVLDKKNNEVDTLYKWIKSKI